MALKTEMNKVDVIVDGRSVAGMYQVVHHRYETISTTTAVVPRSADDPHHHQVSTALIFFNVYWARLVNPTTQANALYCKGVPSKQYIREDFALLESQTLYIGFEFPAKPFVHPK